MRDNVIKAIKEHKIIAIVRGVDTDKIVNTANALKNGGIRLMEITFNQKAPNFVSEACKSIKQISENFENSLCVGAGTVMNVEQVEAAYEAGAKYIISPNVDVSVIKKTLELGMVSIPGALTPTEICIANDAGADFVKLFPAGNIGLSYIKALLGPINNVPMLAVGGIDEKNIKSFIDVGMCGVGIGSSIINLSLINSGQFEKLTELVKLYTGALK